MLHMELFLDQAMATSAALLTERLDAELERRRMEGGEEPHLPTPGPDLVPKS